MHRGNHEAMVLTPKLELRQSQQLVMTPQLQQAIRLLQLSNLELGVFVENELERNPLLERDEIARDGPHETAQGDDKAGHKAESGDRTKLEARNGERLGPNGDHLGDRGGWASLRPSTHNGDGSDGPNLEEFVAASRSLADHLTEQLHLMVTDPAERLIGAHLIHMVDESGYLLGSLDDVAARLGASPTLVDKVLTKLQGFDPPGVLARDLAECLALQLKDANRYDPQIARLLDNLELLGSHNLAALRRAVGVDNDELVEMVAEIKRLNPKPGLRFGSIQIQPILPDVLVRPAPGGSWLVELNSDTLPRVLVNRSYYANVARTARSEQDKGYLHECLQSANWLVKSLDQRARTILRVAEEIVRQQDGFLTHGVEHLKPLNLRTMADAIGMHESTVSRVTTNKYVQTPHGVFELKFFFNSSIRTSDGDTIASESVKEKIGKLIRAEDPRHPHSDQKLVELLRVENIDIARRTVTKYREALGILSSTRRREIG